MTPSAFWFDTETFPIRPGLLAPKLVCLQFSYGDDDPDIVLAKRAMDQHSDAVDVFGGVLASPCLIEAHNLPFDAAVMAAHCEDLIQPIFRMYAAGRARDTQMCETQRTIADGSFALRRKQKGSFSLATLAQKYAGLELDKGSDSWRLRYALLDGVPVEDWPAEAVKYAHEDVTGLRAVSKALRTQFQSPDEWFQNAAAFVLQLAAVWGVRTDPERLEWIEVALLTQKGAAEELLERAGFFKDGSVVQANVRAAVEKAAANLGKPVPRTKPTALQIKKAAAKGLPEPQGQTKMDKDVIEAFGDAEPNLRVLKSKNRADYDLSHYIYPLKGGVKHALYSRPNALIESGRTSWSGSKLRQYNPWWPEGTPEGEEETVGLNLQNLPKAEGVRDCIRPRDGYWWLSVDYDSFELRTLAQSCLWIVGRSVLADRFRSDPGYDPHTELAGHILGIPYAEAMRRKAAGDKDIKKKRQMAKAANFGYPGGLGAVRMIEYAAKEPYFVTLTMAESVALKEQWFEVFPEMRRYFEYVDYCVKKGGTFKSAVTGMLRGDTGFCDGSNHFFQNLAATAAKAALFAVSMACYAEPESPLYGTRPTVLIHDEICAETPIATAHEAAVEMVRLMEREAQRVVPDVPMRATPALSTYWMKAAEPKRDSAGRYTAWDLAA